MSNIGKAPLWGKYTTKVSSPSVASIPQKYIPRAVAGASISAAVLVPDEITAQK